MKSLLGKQYNVGSARGKDMSRGDEIVELKKYVDAKLVLIERASQSSTKTEELNSKVVKMEEKITDLTRLMKLMKTYTESQEQETQKLRDQLKKGHKSELVDPSPKAVELEKRIEYLEREVAETRKNLHENTQSIQGMIAKQGTEIAKELHRLEQKVNSGSSGKGMVPRNVLEDVIRIENILNTWKDKIEGELAGWRRKFNTIETQSVKIEEAHELASKAIESCKILGEKVLQRIKCVEAEQRKHNVSQRTGEFMKKHTKDFDNLKRKVSRDFQKKSTVKKMRPFRNSLTPSRTSFSQLNINSIKKVQERTMIDDSLFPQTHKYNPSDMSPFSRARLAFKQAATPNTTKELQSQSSISSCCPSTSKSRSHFKKGKRQK